MLDKITRQAPRDECEDCDKYEAVIYNTEDGHIDSEAHDTGMFEFNICGFDFRLQDENQMPYGKDNTLMEIGECTKNG